MAEVNKRSIFISHTNSDEKLAHAFRDAVRSMFGDGVVVDYSTNKELQGGIRPGEDWFRWIGDHAREASLALILLTPSSVQKPWVFWEAGAVTGTALATEGEKHRKVRPISFALRSGEIPAPFGHEHVTNGLSRSDMDKFFDDLLVQFSDTLDKQKVAYISRKIDKVVGDYLNAAEEAMRVAPLVVTEAAIQEWIERIEGLETEGRYSEVGELHNWLNVAFGRNEEKEPRPLDVRVHRRLGQLYARARNPERAAQEFALARQLAPRDIFILRKLGKAYLDMRLIDRAGEILEDIQKLDSEAFDRNAENAALKSRWYREQGDYAAAAKALEAAYARNSGSFYLGDLLAQALIALKNIERAREVYSGVFRTIENLRDISIWSCATGLTAAIALGNDGAQAKYTDKLLQLNPTADHAATIVRGISNVAKELKIDDSKITLIKMALRADVS
jgi:tetratricopeptide (TPR) repeat protein